MKTYTHHLFIRVKNLTGTWSHYEGRPFNVCATLPATPSITGNSVLCVGATLNLNASTVSGATSYYWTGPNGYTATTQNITINNVTGMMNGVYSVNAISGSSICDTSNAGSINVSVTVTDNTNPTITAPSNITVAATSCTASSVTLGTPVSSDNCSVSSVTNNAPSSFPIGTTTVIWTVTDGSGNTATATQTVTVTGSDAINPTITAPVNLNIGTNSSCTATGVNLGTPITADNCSVASVSNDAPSTFVTGSTIVLWTVTDGNGNTATATQMVTVTDEINPTISAPSNVNATAIGCAASGLSLGSPITSDNCLVASVTNNAPSSFPIGTTSVTWTVIDGTGNTATATQTVTVTGSDAINPTITSPVNLNISTNSSCTATGVNLGTPITADNCSVASVTNNAPSSFPIGTTTVTWTVTDGSGNIATTTQTVTVSDNTNPTITAPATVSACIGSAVVLGSPITSDNCSVSSVTNNAPTSFPVGTTPVIWTVTDGNGNSATATQMITVNSMPNITTNLVGATINSNQSGATYNWADCNNNYALVSGTSSSYTATINGNYAVIVSLGSCIDTSNCVLIEGLSLNDLSKVKNEITLYPNPTTDNLVVESTGITISSIIIRDLNGKLLIKKEVFTLKTQIDVRQLSKGAYLIECVTENGSHIERIVIQ